MGSGNVVTLDTYAAASTMGEDHPLECLLAMDYDGPQAMDCDYMSPAAYIRALSLIQPTLPLSDFTRFGVLNEVGGGSSVVLNELYLAALHQRIFPDPARFWQSRHPGNSL